MGPYDSCAAKPFLTACPAGAFRGMSASDVAACAAHIRTTEGADCNTGCCRARRECPVGAEHPYRPAQGANFSTRRRIAFQLAQLRNQHSRIAAAKRVKKPVIIVLRHRTQVSEHMHALFGQDERVAAAVFQVFDPLQPAPPLQTDDGAGDFRLVQEGLLRQLDGGDGPVLPDIE